MTKSQNEGFIYPFDDGPQIKKERLDEFIAIYEAEFGEELRWQDADPIAKDLVRLVDGLLTCRVVERGEEPPMKMAA